MAGNTAYDLENSDHVWSIRERAKSFGIKTGKNNPLYGMHIPGVYFEISYFSAVTNNDILSF